jgi:thymidylate synthase
VHDHWINPAEGKWEYTYHQRLCDYDVPAGSGDFVRYNQIDKCVEMLKDCWYTRRAQAVTWKVWEDLGITDPACLQRMWFRVQDHRLNMVVHMRSNDAFKASFMNMYAFVELQREMADRIGIEVGEYCHIADSFHIYGSYFDEFEGFLKMVRSRQPADRVWSSDYGLDMFVEGCDTLLAEPEMPEDKKKLVRARKSQLEAVA